NELESFHHRRIEAIDHVRIELDLQARGSNLGFEIAVRQRWSDRRHGTCSSIIDELRKAEKSCGIFFRHRFDLLYGKPLLPQLPEECRHAVWMQRVARLSQVAGDDTVWNPERAHGGCVL